MRPPRQHRVDLQLDFRAGLPVYQQIIRQVRQLAASGGLRPGDQLPTVRELAVQLGVNFNTVARAYRLLDQAGVVSAQQGRGTFIAQRLAAPAGRIPTLRRLTAEYIAQARRQDFTRAQIAAMVNTRLRLDRRRNSGGGQ